MTELNSSRQLTSCLESLNMYNVLQLILLSIVANTLRADEPNWMSVNDLVNAIDKAVGGGRNGGQCDTAKFGAFTGKA